LKILHAGKVFFHFFEIFLIGQLGAIVMPQPPFLAVLSNWAGAA